MEDAEDDEGSPDRRICANHGEAVLVGGWGSHTCVGRFRRWKVIVLVLFEAGMGRRGGGVYHPREGVLLWVTGVCIVVEANSDSDVVA